jgi:hypothetical protein
VLLTKQALYLIIQLLNNTERNKSTSMRTPDVAINPYSRVQAIPWQMSHHQVLRETAGLHDNLLRKECQATLIRHICNMYKPMVQALI